MITHSSNHVIGGLQIIVSHNKSSTKNDRGMLRLFIFCVSQTYLISVARVQLKILASCCTTRVKMQVNIALVNCDHGLTYLVGSSSHKQKFISFINGFQVRAKMFILIELFRQISHRSKNNLLLIAMQS